MPNNNESWKEWSKYVLLELKRINALLLQQEKYINELKVKLAILSTKVLMLAAATSIIMTAAINYIVRSL